MPRSRQTLLELLLPRGLAASAVVVGSACPPRLAPRSRGDAGGPVDLAVLAPSAAELRQPGWIADAVARCAAQLAPDGIVYVLVEPRARRAVRRLLGAEGLHVELALLHLADAADSRHLVALEPVAARHAFKQIVPLVPWKRVVAETLLALGGAGALAATGDGVGLVARRAGAAPLLDWLRVLDGASAPYRGVVLSSSWRPGGPRVVLHPFAASRSSPPIVAKAVLDDVGQTLSEASRLQRVAPSAGRAGAAVPTLLCSSTVEGAPVLLESRLDGRILAPLLARRPAALESVLERVCAWLEQWQRMTAAPAPLRRETLEREVLAPAEQLAPVLDDGAAYVAALSRRCDALVAVTAPLAAAHNDLTMWNVLTDGREGLAVVDWEVAEEQTLPLKDFFYAAVDAVAATRRYGDRPGAYDACFGLGGSRSAMIAELEASMAAAIGAQPELVELSRHACWLGHALDESRSAEACGQRPFLEIARRSAASV